MANEGIGATSITKNTGTFATSITVAGVTYTTFLSAPGFYSIAGSSVATSSGTYGTLLSTGSVAYGGTKLEILATAGFLRTVAAGTARLRVTVDSVEKFSWGQTSTVATSLESTGANFVVTGLTAGNHTVIMEWKTDAGTITADQSDATKNALATLLIRDLP